MEIQMQKNLEDDVHVEPIKHITDPDMIHNNYQDYLTDESKYRVKSVESIIFANSSLQVSEVMRKCFEDKKCITISGGRTGIVGGAIAEEGSILSLENMNQFIGVRWIETKNAWGLRIQPGVSLNDIKWSLDNATFNWKIDQSTNQEAIKKFENESNQWFYPPDPTEKTAHLGGTVATNASGSRSYQFGPTRNYITALEVVLSNGYCLQIQRGQYVLSKKADSFNIKLDHEEYIIPVPSYKYPNLKCSAGYYTSSPMDLIDYIIGSEGTLGIITEIEILLVRKPEIIIGCLVFFLEINDAIQLVTSVNQERKQSEENQFSAIEFFDNNSLDLLKEDYSNLIPQNSKCALYLENQTSENNLDHLFEYIENIISENNGISEATWAATDAPELEKMTEFRHSVPERINGIIAKRQINIPDLKKISTDFVVPENNFDELYHFYLDQMHALDLQYVLFGHIGDYHLHLNILPRNEKELEMAQTFYMNCADKVINLQGTISGEHGLGKLKKTLLSLMYTKEDIDQMKEIKMAFDPHDILGKNTLF